MRDFRKLQALFNNILNNLPCHLCVRDADHDNRILFASAKLYQDYGFPPGSWTGRNIAEILPSELAGNFTQSDASVKESGKPIREFKNIPFADGKIHNMLMAHCCHRSHTETMIVTIGIGVSELQENRKRLQTALKQQDIIGECFRTMLLEEDPENSIHRILDTVRNYLAATRCHIVSCDYNGNMMSITQETIAPGGKPRFTDIPSLPLTDNEKWLEILRSRKPLLLRDLHSVRDREILGSWPPYAIRDKVSSLYSVGIFRQNRLWGCIAAVYEEGERKVFSDSDLSFLQASGNLFEILLERSHFSKELKQSEVEKKIRLDAVPIPILLYRTDAGLLRGNNAAMSISPFKESEIMEHPYEDYNYFCGFHSRPAEYPVMRTSKDGMPHKMDVTIGGREYQVCSYPVVQNGKMTYILKTLIDMTERNNNERRLKQALEQAGKQTGGKEIRNSVPFLKS